MRLNCRIERGYGIFSRIDACSYVLNIFDDGNVLSIVTDCSPHGTHVAGITAAHHPEVRVFITDTLGRLYLTLNNHLIIYDILYICMPIENILPTFDIAMFMRYWNTLNNHNSRCGSWSLPFV